MLKKMNEMKDAISKNDEDKESMLTQVRKLCEANERLSLENQTLEEELKAA